MLKINVKIAGKSSYVALKHQALAVHAWPNFELHMVSAEGPKFCPFTSIFLTIMFYDGGD